MHARMCLSSPFEVTHALAPGIADLQYIKSLDAAALEEVTMEVGMEPGHARTFIRSACE
jgi:hypothetical protein